MFDCKCKYFVRHNKKRHKPGTVLRLSEDELKDVGKGAFESIVAVEDDAQSDPDDTQDA